MEIRIPAPAEEIIEKLNEHGYEAYVVGGCVRDMLLGREPGDWDITTSALPEQVKQVFRRTVDTGIQHGTVTVMIGNEGYEVTTYRIDGEYLDGRHPNSVEYTSSLTEDLKRRDFTINAMAYNRKVGFVDEFGGVEDLKKGVVRCVGDPMDRFTEDALRILRAIRFSAQLGFSIEGHTFDAIRVIAPNIKHVSKERIQTELTKLLLSAHPEHISLVYETGISPYVSKAFHEVFHEARCRQIPVSITPVKSMRWAALLRKCPEDQAVRILKDLKLDNDTIYRVRTLVAWQGRRIEPDPYPVRLAMSRMEPELFDDLLDFKTCLAKAAMGRQEGMDRTEGMEKWPEKGMGEGMEERMEERPETPDELERIRNLVHEIRQSGDCISLKNLAVSGHHIMAAGVKPGKEVGETLARLLDLVLEEPGRNTREYLLSRLR